MTEEFKRELAIVLNKHSIDNETNTPDFILADMLCGQLKVWRDSRKWLRDWETK